MLMIILKVWLLEKESKRRGYIFPVTGFDIILNINKQYNQKKKKKK